MQGVKKISIYNVQNCRVMKNEKVLARLQNCQCKLLSVTEADRLPNIVILDNIMELIMIQAALQEGLELTKMQA